MRITAGEFRGRILQAPKGNTVRPTSDRTRQAVFNILTAGRWRNADDPDLVDAHVMDIFCGTGALGLEALSRGAASCVFIDADKTSLAFTHMNAEALKLESRASILLRDAAKIGAKPAAMRLADFVFLDPPYRKNLVPPAVAALEQGGWLSASAVLIVETEKDNSDALSALPFETADAREYGDTMIRILRKL